MRLSPHSNAKDLDASNRNPHSNPQSHTGRRTPRSQTDTDNNTQRQHVHCQRTNETASRGTGSRIATAMPRRTAETQLQPSRNRPPIHCLSLSLFTPHRSKQLLCIIKKTAHDGRYPQYLLPCVTMETTSIVCPVTGLLSRALSNPMHPTPAKPLLRALALHPPRYITLTTLHLSLQRSPIPLFS
jgi:hypothetical protein